MANIIRFTAGDSQWYRIHARQALLLGIAASAGFLTVLAFPLIAVIAIPTLSTAATIGVYGVGLVLDALVALGYLVAAIRYARRVARGELFTIPVVTPLADALFGSRV